MLMNPTTLQTVIFIALVSGKVSSVKLCYFCLSQCSSPMTVENCETRYQDATKCVSAETNDGSIVRKQCMSIEQADIFCNKFNIMEGISCYSCDEDLCNNNNSDSLTYSRFLLLLSIFLLR